MTPIQTSLEKKGCVHQKVFDKRKKEKPMFKLLHNFTRPADFNRTFSNSDTTNHSKTLHKITVKILKQNRSIYQIKFLIDVMKLY